MALSVSGFPEPPSMAESSAELSPSSQEGYKTLINHPKLRGLFGKKPDSRPAREYHEQDLNDAVSTPPSPSIIPSPISSSSDDALFQFPPHSHDLNPLIQRRSSPPQLQASQKSPLPSARVYSGPVRLEIGSAGRTSGAPHLHTVPKPPTVVVQEWSTQNAAPTLSPPRPLPMVPGPMPESSPNAGPSNPISTLHRPTASRALKASGSRPRSHTQNIPPISTRYFPLATEAAGKEPSPSSASAQTRFRSGSQTRPLPPIPPRLMTLSALPPSLSRSAPPTGRVKRPRTSSGPGAGSSANSRSPFDAVPSSWASRPVDLHRSLPVQTSPPPTPAPSRDRSRSRPGRDRSVGSPRGYRAHPSPSHTSPASATVLTTSPIAPARAKPSSPRRKASITPPLPSQPESKPLNEDTTPPSSPSPPPKTEDDVDLIAPIHSHPMDASCSIDPDRLIYVPRPNSPEPVAKPCSVEALVDDLDYSSFSRSPSPMRYARPNSRGSFSDDSSRSTSPSRTLHTQPRSFKVNYGGPTRHGSSKSPSPMRYAERSSFDVLKDLSFLASSPPQKRHKQPKSYQFDHNAAKASSPFTRHPSSELKSGSTQSQKTESDQTVVHGLRSRSRGRSTRRSKTETVYRNSTVLDISAPLPLLEIDEVPPKCPGDRRVSKSLPCDRSRVVPDIIGKSHSEILSFEKRYSKDPKREFVEKWLDLGTGHGKGEDDDPVAIASDGFEWEKQTVIQVVPKMRRLRVVNP